MDVSSVPPDCFYGDIEPTPTPISSQRVTCLLGAREPRENLVCKQSTWEREGGRKRRGKEGGIVRGRGRVEEGRVEGGELRH